MQVCKHWSRRGYCLYKEKCFYRHPPDALPDMPAVADVRCALATSVLFSQCDCAAEKQVGVSTLSACAGTTMP